ncbi:MAG: OmpA family protein [Pyrinomonadaceae bacterium]|nr:OmpA family protein [Pyrinomonadaceae bacterium]
MSDSKKNPKIPPPDDFAETTPNIPRDENPAWDNDDPSETPADDWGKTVINYNVEEEHEETGGFEEQLHPSAGGAKQPDWGMTQANVDINDDFGEEDAGAVGGVTTPYFKLPEADREKYQVVPPTAAEKAEKEESKKKKGIPAWFWATAGIMTFLAFAFIVFLAILFFFLPERGYELRLRNVPPGSKINVDGVRWGVEDEDKGKVQVLTNLSEGEHEFEIVNPNYECSNNPFKFTGDNGGTYSETLTCKTKGPSLDCANTRNVAERAKCAEMALDALGNPPDIDALLRALNMLIINFASGSANVPSDKRAILRKASEKINQLPTTAKIEVGGHTDDRGSDANNQKLSERRAEAVANVLLGFGVRRDALTTKGYGESQPKADNKTEQGRFDNRRIQYTAVSR